MASFPTIVFFPVIASYQGYQTISAVMFLEIVSSLTLLVMMLLRKENALTPGDVTLPI